MNSTYGWIEGTLGGYFRIKHGYAFKGEFFADSGEYILLTPGNFQVHGGLQERGEREKYYQGHFPPEFLLRPGDMLVVMTDLMQNAPILGSPAIIQSADKFLHNQRLGKILGLDESKMNKSFLYHLFNLPDVRSQIRGSATGSTVRHTAPGRIYAVKVRVPPLAVQKRIASILSAYDDLIENNNRRIKILEDMAQMLYREWFVNFRFPGHGKVRMVESELGPIPECWRVGRLDDAVVLQRGFDLPTAQRKPGTVPIIAATGPNGTHNVAKVKGPGVVTGRSGSLGAVMLVWEDFWPLNTALWAKEFRQSNPIHTYYTLRDLDLKGFNSGAAVPTLNRNDIHGLPTILPDNGTLNAFNECVLPLFMLKRNLEAKNNNLRTTRDFLLPKVISGEIPVEAAEELVDQTA